ncbi:MAG: hypothetical protein FIA99_11450 [Ruminiclostridium sp.]|nr:hypothetical protein [Ruminiclostridium sp.]
MHKSKLCIEKLAGGISACLGLNKKGRYYAPISALKVDMRDLIYKQERIIAIFTKYSESKLYTHITYSANEVDINEEIYIQIMQLLDMDNLICDFSEKPVFLNRLSELINRKISTEKIDLELDIEP